MSENSAKNRANAKPAKACKSKFTQEEDLQLVKLIISQKEPDWAWIASQMPNRNPRQCRERWANYLNPNLHKGEWTQEEDNIILEKKNVHGQKWSIIASYLNGRSGNDVRNRWLMLMRHSQKQKNLKAKKISRFVGAHGTDQNQNKPFITPHLNIPQPVINSNAQQTNENGKVRVESVQPKKVMFAPIFTLVPDLQYYQFVL